MTVHKNVVSDLGGNVHQVTFTSGDHRIDVLPDSFIVDGVNEYNAECIDDLLALVHAAKSEYVAHEVRKANPARIFLVNLLDPTVIGRSFRVSEPA